MSDVLILGRVAIALRAFCWRARASGLDCPALSRVLLRASAQYAQSAGWSAARARRELDEQWKSVAPGERDSAPGGVVENPDRRSDE